MTAALKPDDGLLDTEQAAKYLGRVSPKTLDTWRSRGGGPEFCRVGRLVRYPVESLDQYIANRMYKSTASRTSGRSVASIRRQAVQRASDETSAS